MQTIPDALLGGANIVTLVCVVWHMNAMSPRTPWLEISAWWCLGTGTFGELLWRPHDVQLEHVAVSVGVAFLSLLVTQPHWRPLLANRRKNAEQPLPPDCDRRCQTYMSARKSSDRAIA